MGILKKANSYANAKQRTDADLVGIRSSISTASSRNFLINGNLDVWQRNTTFSSLSGFSSLTNYTADRFAYGSAGTTSSMNVQRSSDVPTLAESGHVSNSSIRFSPQVADATVGAGDVALVYQPIEGYDYNNIKGKTVTLSFWVKSSLTGTYCVAFKNNGADRSYVAEYQVPVANVWSRVSITLALNYTGGTENVDNGTGLLIEWTLMCGTTFQTTPGVWQNGDFSGTASQVNFNGNTLNQLFLAQIMLTLDSEAVPFVGAGQNIAEEIEMCERYYEKSYNLNTVVATSDSAGRIFEVSTAANEIDAAYSFKTRKRAAPTVTYFDKIGISTGPTTVNSGQAGFSVDGLTTSPNSNYQFHWVADAEL